MIKKLVLVFLGLIIQGCTYNGTIKDLPASSASFSASVSSESITLIDNKDEIENPKFKYGVATVSYDIKDSLMNVAKNTLKSVFGRVDVAKAPIPANQLYAVPHFSMGAASGVDITTGLVSSAKIDLYDTQEKRYLTSITTNIDTKYVRPGSLNTLGFLTGFTLFVATPFTLPAAVNIAGENVGELIQDNQKAMTASLRRELAAKRNFAEVKTASDDCHAAIINDPSIRILVGKVSLLGVKDQTFDMLANTKKPNAEEKEALRAWGASLDRCVDKDDKVFRSTNAPGEVVAHFNAMRTNKSNLIIGLYNGEMSYGEFARKRRENSAQFDAALAKILSDLDQRERDSADRQQQLSIEQERTTIARAQANAAESMAFQSMISNIQQTNSNLVQQQTLNRLNRQPVYQAPIRTTCTPGFGSVNCTSY
jgi:hypothetical protein